MNNEIMINDIVTINPDYVKYSYSIYTEWFETYDIDSESYSTAPLLEAHISITDESYRVEWIAPHLSINRILYAIRGVRSNYLFLVEEKVIGTHIHTIQSRVFDPAIIYKKLSKRISALKEDNLKLIRDNLELMEESIKLMEENNKLKENSKVSNPMPPLENGWFGLSKGYNFDGDCVTEHWFVAILKGEYFDLIYEDGGHDNYSNKKDALFCHDVNGVCKNDEGKILGEIIFLCNAYDFSHAKRIYEQKNNRNEIWRKY